MFRHKTGYKTGSGGKLLFNCPIFFNLNCAEFINV